MHKPARVEIPDRQVSLKGEFPHHPQQNILGTRCSSGLFGSRTESDAEAMPRIGHPPFRRVRASLLVLSFKLPCLSFRLSIKRDIPADILRKGAHVESDKEIQPYMKPGEVRSFISHHTYI